MLLIDEHFLHTGKYFKKHYDLNAGYTGFTI